MFNVLIIALLTAVSSAAQKSTLLKVQPGPAYPALGDIDGDGDLDLLVGLQQDNILYYENVGTRTQPRFVERQSIPIARGLFHPKPALYDLDQDGRLDLFFGTNRGTIGWYRNGGLKGDRTIDWQPVKTGIDDADSFLNIRHPDLNSHISFGDVDRDGDIDFFVTGTFGTIAFFENVGGQFVQRTVGDVGRSFKDINGFDVNVGPGGRPFLVDIDADGDLDILAGQGASIGLVVYINKSTRPGELAKFEFLTNTFMKDQELGGLTSVVAVDIDANNMLDLFVGNGSGELLQISDVFPAPPTGLKAEYFSDLRFNRPAFTRIDPQINFDFGVGSPDPRVPADNFSIRWTGQIQIDVEDTYTFITTSDDGVRLFIDGQLIINDFNFHAPAENRGQIFLTRGRHLIKLEYFEGSVLALIRLEIQSASMPRQVVPASMLFPTEANGLLAEYFDNIDFAPAAAGLPALTRIDDRIDFSFGTSSPHARVPADNFSVRWTGEIQINAAGAYTFITTSDDGARLYIDNRLVINSNFGEAQGQVTLQPGRHALRLEYFDLSSTAAVRLEYQGPSIPRQVIPSSVLFPPTEENGLFAEYFGDRNFTQLAFSRVDRNIDFVFGLGSPDPRVPADNFSIRWTGQLLATANETYTFIATSDDGVKVYIDDQLIIDNFTEHPPTENQGQILLKAGRHTIRVEYFEATVFSVIRLEYQSQSIPRQTVPANVLFPR